MTPAGLLRHRVTLQAPPTGANIGGEIVAAPPTEVGTYWAAVRPLGVSENVGQEQVRAIASHEVTMRYVAGVTTQHRILFGTRVLNIVSVTDEDELHLELKLTCKEAV